MNSTYFYLSIFLLFNLSLATELPNHAEKDPYFDRWQETFYGDIKPNLNNFKGDIPEEIKKIIDCMKNRTGNCAPAYILYGPPGNGKTTLGQVIAKEVQGVFLSTSSSDFEGHLNGTGAERLEKLFERAYQLASFAPVIISIDEIDSLATHLGKTIDTNVQHLAQTYQKLLKHLDNLPKNNEIILLGTTNRRMALDQALTRHGRAESVEIQSPNLDSRKAILKHYVQLHANTVNEKLFDEIAKKCEGFSASSFEKMAKLALVNGSISEKSLKDAWTKITKLEKENRTAADYHAKKEENKDKLVEEQRDALKWQKRFNWTNVGIGTANILLGCAKLYIKYQTGQNIETTTTKEHSR